jgi:hypothetical protein
MFTKASLMGKMVQGGGRLKPELVHAVTCLYGGVGYFQKVPHPRKGLRT